MTISFNPSTGRCVILEPDGTFVSAWKLRYEQRQHVIRAGEPGGGH